MNLRNLQDHKPLRTLTGVLFVFCILLSSCSVKYSLKNLFKAETTSGHGFAKKTASACATGSACTVKALKETLAAAGNASPHTDFPLSTLNGEGHTFGEKWASSSASVPPTDPAAAADGTLALFLEYRKLLL